MPVGTRECGTTGIPSGPFTDIVRDGGSTAGLAEAAEAAVTPEAEEAADTAMAAGAVRPAEAEAAELQRTTGCTSIRTRAGISDSTTQHECSSLVTASRQQES